MIIIEEPSIAFDMRDRAGRVIGFAWRIEQLDSGSYRVWAYPTRDGRPQGAVAGRAFADLMKAQAYCRGRCATYEARVAA